MTLSFSANEDRSVVRFCEATTTGGSVPLECGEWSIAAGETWFVAGGPGSGKTALLRTIAGLERPVAGRIERFGRDWEAMAEFDRLRQRRRIGLVLSRDAGLFHRLTVLENVCLPLHYHGGRGGREIRERASRLLEEMQIAEHAHDQGLNTSPRVARRAVLARSLAVAPEVLLLDEPCAGLEEWERRRLVRLILRMRHQGTPDHPAPATLLVSGTDPELWRRVPEVKWVVLRNGRLCVVQDWEQLVASAPELFQTADVELPPD